MPSIWNPPMSFFFGIENGGLGIGSHPIACWAITPITESLPPTVSKTC